MDRQRIINLFAAISMITILGFALGLMFPLLALIMEKRGINPHVNTTWGLGALVGSLIAGWSMQSFGPDGLPYSMALIFALFLLVMVTREVRKAP